MTGNTSCPHCRAPVTVTVDNDTAGLPITLHPHPTTRDYVLLHIANGGRAVIAESDRTWQQQQTRYYALDRWRIPNPNLATYPHYVDHTCGVTPPPAEQPTRPSTQEARF